MNKNPPKASTDSGQTQGHCKLTRRTAGLALLGALGVVIEPMSEISLAHAATPSLAAAPDFTLRSLGGPNLRLAEQRGQIVMINFWATWCAPCREEMPHLARLFQKYQGSGFTLLGVNVDDDARHAAGTATRLGLPFPVLFDSEKTVVKAYAVTTMPSTVLIDRDGRLRHMHKGYKAGTEDTYETLLRGLLKE